ncbi:MAG: NETI motif-containing protein [Bacillota bacterium]
MSNKKKRSCTPSTNRKASTSQKKRKKERFIKQTNESLDDCLDRIKQAGYMPVRRVEKPIFEEVLENGSKVNKVVSSDITFDAILIKDEQ